MKFREPVNGLTHFIGWLGAIAATILLIIETISPLRLVHLITFCVFGAGMIALYTSSTLYHWLNLGEEGIKKLRKLDHSMIFVLIAATYTPICLLVLRGTLGWVLLISMWTIAISGIIFKMFWLQAPRWLSTTIYIAMSWSAVVVVYPLVQHMEFGALMWLLIGGIFYTTGAVIYGIKKPDFFPGRFGFHELFHVFVICGTFSHFWVMYHFLTYLPG